MFVIVLLLTLNLVSAIGIRPAKTNIFSDEGKDYSNNLWIVNSDGKELTVNIYIEGEMAEYITINKKTLTFRSDDDAKAIDFEIHLPEIVPPGKSTANIVVEEKLKEINPLNVVSSKIILKHKILIEGPYPEKYIKAKLNFHDQGEQIKFVSEVENLGKKDINNIQTTFYVNDKEQKQQVLETESTSLERKENKLLDINVNKELFQLGEYEVSAVTKYDDQKVEIVKSLLVGKPEVDITYFDKYFIANKVNQYTMELLNKWNKKVENIYVDVTVKKDNLEIDEFRTKSVDINGELRKRINDYFDARDKSEGKYVFEMVVNFWNNYRMDQKSYEIELLTEEGFEGISGGNINAALVGNTAGEGGGTFWIIIGILLGVIGILGTYVGYRYKNKDNYD